METKMTPQAKPAANRTRGKTTPQPKGRSAGKAEAPKAARKTAVKDTAVHPTKPQTKRARLIEILSAKTGTDIDTLSETFGWQQHSTRAALTGLRKAGFEIARNTPAGGGKALYRITAMPRPVAAG